MTRRTVAHEEQAGGTTDQSVEVQVQRAKREWEETFDAVPDLIALIDTDYHILRVNRAFSDRVGCHPSAVIGRTCHDVMHARTEPCTDCPLHELQANPDTCSVQVHENHMGGDFLISVSPLRNPDGSLRGAVHVARDVTELNRTQHELAAARRELEQRVEERTAELARTVKTLQAEIEERARAEAEVVRRREEVTRMGRVNALGELSASLAHELNQPLAAIVSNAQAGSRFALGDTPDLDEVRAILADIAADGKRAGEIITRLRGMLKLGDVATEAVDINRAVEECLELVHSDSVVRSVHVERKLGDRLPRVEGNHVQILQVLLNLMMNALDAMREVPEGRRTLTVTTRLDGADGVAVDTCDSGPGLDTKEPNRIFDTLFTTKENGLGMGLSISRTIIEAHGGTLTTRNREEGGACFTFTLPVVGEGNG